MSQLCFASLTPKKKNQLRQEQFLEEMRGIVPWRKIARLIKPDYYRNSAGRQAYDLILMIKLHCLQKWYNLGDLATQEAIYDRHSFAKFLDINLMVDRVPDEATILNFCHLLEANDLPQKIFALINKHLEQKGLLMKRGTIMETLNNSCPPSSGQFRPKSRFRIPQTVSSLQNAPNEILPLNSHRIRKTAVIQCLLMDATIIDSPSSTKNRDKKRDEEMSSTRKNGQWHFGMKAHIGVDADSGIVHHCIVTTAKAADVDLSEELLHWDEKAIFGDKGYVSMDNKRWARANGIFWGIPDRGGNKKALSSSQKKQNKKLSRNRAKVEHPFRIIKDLWGHRKTRDRGLKKNMSKMQMLFGLSNPYMVRKALI